MLVNVSFAKNPLLNDAKLRKIKRRLPGESDYRRVLMLLWSQPGVMQKELCQLMEECSSHCQTHQGISAMYRTRTKVM